MIKPRRFHHMYWLIVVASLIVFLWTGGLFRTRAENSCVPTRPAITPVTPTQPSPPTSEPMPTATSLPPALTQGASVKLHVRSDTAYLWTEVQWQDAAGNWHPTDGWTGVMENWSDGEGTNRWWVSRDDFGTGPFRWAVYTSEGGTQLAVSDPFYLPRTVGETVGVELSVPVDVASVLPESGGRFELLEKQLTVGITLMLSGVVFALMAKRMRDKISS